MIAVWESDISDTFVIPRLTRCSALKRTGTFAVPPVSSPLSVGAILEKSLFG